MVILNVLKTHNRSTWKVYQLQSHVSTLFIYSTPFLCMVYWLSRVNKILSSAWNKFYWRCIHLWLFPNYIPRKLSTKMSMYAIVCALLWSRCGSQVSVTREVWRSRLFGLSAASVWLSYFGGNSVTWWRKAELDRLSTVYISVNNKGREFFHPMGRVVGMSTSSYVSSSNGNRRPIFGHSSSRRYM